MFFVDGRAVASLELDEIDEVRERPLWDEDVDVGLEGKIPDDEGLGRVIELDGEDGFERFRGLDSADLI